MLRHKSCFRISRYTSKSNKALFQGHIISDISDSQTKIRDQILTESIRLQFRDFITVILVFPFIYMYHSFNSMVKDNENLGDFESRWLF